MTGRKNNKGNAVIADHGDWLEVDVSTASNPGAAMKIDRDYWEAICSAVKYRIYAMNVGRGCVYAATKYGGKTAIFIHRIMLGRAGNVVKHVSGDGLDNRISNLRVELK